MGKVRVAATKVKVIRKVNGGHDWWSKSTLKRKGKVDEVEVRREERASAFRSGRVMVGQQVSFCR